MSARFYVRLSQACLCLQLLATLACDVPTEPSTPTVATIEVTPPAPALQRGGELQLAAQPRDADGAPLDDHPVTWTSLTPTLLSVTGSGRVSGLATGAATIAVSAGGVVREVEIAVLDAPLVELRVDVGKLTLRELAQATVPVTLRNALGETVDGVPLQWESSAPTVVSVQDGTVQGLREGAATIRVAVGTLAAELVVVVDPDFGGDLVYASPDGPFGASRLYRMDGVDDATARLIVDLNAYSQPAVSPDGQRIAFVCPGSGPAICVANIDGSGIEMLTSEEATYEDQPSWSPDGSRIAFRRYSAIGSQGPWNPSDIWVMAADGSAQVNLTQDTLSQHWPTWSPATAPGGVKIAFVDERIVEGFQTSRIAVMAADGSNRRFVTAAGTHEERRPQWMPGATALLYTRVGGGYDAEMRVVDVATGAERRLLEESLIGGGDRHPTVSPNGRYVVFASAHEEVGGRWAPQVYTVRLDGSDLRRRTSGTQEAREFAWVPTP